MNIAFIIFDGMTSLDFVGVFDAVTRLKTMGYLPEFNWDICAIQQEVTDGTGLVIRATSIAPPLGTYDGVIIPGGFSTRQLVGNKPFTDWIATARSCKWIVSVCTGSLLVGAAGLLEGRAATTHPGAFDFLRNYTPSVLTDRIVDSGTVISAGGVTAAIDLGLYLCEKMAGRDVRKAIQTQMDYPYYPEFYETHSIEQSERGMEP